MPQPWSFTQSSTVAGRWQLLVTPMGGKVYDLTNFRGVPTKIGEYSFTDPFGDSLASLQFPQVTGYDDLSSPEFAWLRDGANVDIAWVPTKPGSTVINPLTNQRTLDLATPGVVWEGFISSKDIEQTDTGSYLAVQCQGALLQLDRYKAKPAYPSRPILYEEMIRREFDRARRPNLRTRSLAAPQFPAGWAKTMPASGAVNVYTPTGASPGAKITGYWSRSTGSWEASLTSFIQSLLATMFTQNDCGVTPGNQWTVLKDPGRQPVLKIRDRYRTPDFSFWYGQPGVKANRLTQDGTQIANVVYGEGTGLDGVNWRNAVVADDGSYTDYAPIAWRHNAYPPVANPTYDPSVLVNETYTRFPSGFDQVTAMTSSAQVLQRDADPGWTGEVVISIDPSPTMSRFQIRAGMTMLLQGFSGTGATGMPFHLAEVTINPDEGTVTCKVDTAFRDLLTLEEVIARTRDPLTPAKMLQVNRRQVLIEDIVAPWDYTAGSGYMPRQARVVLNQGARSDTFPWTATPLAFPPQSHPQYYIRVKGRARDQNARWSFFPILMSQRGTIRRVEMAAYAADGTPLAAAFHLSLYYTHVTVTAMPMQNGIHSPFFTGAFESTQPNGLPWPTGNFFAPDDSIIIGWGNSVQPAGYSPGSFANGNPATGRLVDESSWSFDCMNNPNFDKNARVGERIPTDAITIWGALYTDYPADVYFMGRMYRQEPGT